MNIKLLVLVLLCSSELLAQNAIIKGNLIDQETKSGLPFATISVKGTSIIVNSDIDGNYQLQLPAGNHTILYDFLGYESKEIDVSLNGEKINTFNINLSAENFQLEALVVHAKKQRSRESTLLVDQQRSLEIKQNIGAEELSRKGVGDVAAAIIKTVGVSKQESNGNIFVRGLGDRYNSTSMNGLPIPSNDPENKNISLELFSSGIVEYISIDKTYSSRHFGDFAGANIDIVSKKYSGNGFFDFSIGTNGNANAIKQDPFKLLSDRNYFGFSDNSLPYEPLGNYSFKNSFKIQKKNPYGFNFGINTGKSFDVGKEGSLNFFATASFTNNYGYKEGITRSAQAQGDFTKDLYQKTYSYNTNTTGMFNADYNINSAHNIQYNILFINGSSEKNDEYSGYLRDLAETGENGFLRRGVYRQNTLIVNQLLGKHLLREPFNINWGLSYSNTIGQTPDRLQYTSKTNSRGERVFVSNSTSDNHRYFDHLKEVELAFNTGLVYNFAKKEENIFAGKIIFGYDGRVKNRNFEATQFNFDITDGYNLLIPNLDNVDTFFNSENLNKNLFSISTFRGGKNVPNALKPQKYTGSLQINAGFATLEYSLNPELFAVLSVRVENITQEVSWQTQLDPKEKSDMLKKIAFLPNLSLKYELNENSNLRLAASKTYTLPQFKERALFIYEDVTQVKRGNPDLYASDDYNLDLKWEYFPENNELISATFFGKYILNPINETLFSSSANDITYINTGDYGYVAGVEVEFRKNIIRFGFENRNKIIAGLNAALMKTYQLLDNEKIARETKLTTSFTDISSAFSGASSFLMNMDMSYILEWEEKGITSTISYALFSDKINAIGTEKKGNLVDKSYGSLDFVFKTKFSKNFGMGLNFKNILDPKIERIQEIQNVLVQSYKIGRNFSLSLNYSF